MFFEGFREWDEDLSTGVRLHGRSGGDGPAVVLLHGHPRAHTTWYRVAPQLVERGFTVVCPDLRGYGRSGKPGPDTEHRAYSDRAMAADVAALMDRLGHPRFAVAGHDRGQGVAYRCALDHSDAVTALAVLDGVPMLEAVERVDARFAVEWWHWFFFAGSPHAERVITADPVAWYGLDDEKRAVMGEDNFAYVAAALNDPRTVLAMLEDYRAACPSTPRTTGSTASSAVRSAAPPWWGGPCTTTWSTCTATRRRSGAPGSTTWSPRHGSTAGTTWPRRTRSSWLTCSPRS